MNVFLLQWAIAFVICKREVTSSKFDPMHGNFGAFTSWTKHQRRSVGIPHRRSLRKPRVRSMIPIDGREQTKTIFSSSHHWFDQRNPIRKDDGTLAWIRTSIPEWVAFLDYLHQWKQWLCFTRSRRQQCRWSEYLGDGSVMSDCQSRSAAVNSRYIRTQCERTLPTLSIEAHLHLSWVISFVRYSERQTR